MTSPIFSGQPANRATLIRLTLLCFLALFWLYAKSVFAPWAESPEPRLWLYDTLLYSGFFLWIWGVGEAIRLVVVLRQHPQSRNQLAIAALLLGIAGLTGLAHHVLNHTGTGWDLRIAWSAEQLEAFTTPSWSDQRQRVGWLLVDSVRMPCQDQAWLWLGRPFGGGSGINRALVFSPDSVPLTPHESGLRFVAVNDFWWMAYQNPDRFYGETSLEPAQCRQGTTLASHRQGERFIAGR